MQIRLKLASSEYISFQLDQEVQAFNIVLIEPESGQEVEFVTPLTQCLTQDELFFDDARLKDMKQIRKLAKRVLEDRVQISRVQAQAAADASGLAVAGQVRDGEDA